MLQLFLKVFDEEMFGNFNYYRSSLSHELRLIVSVFRMIASIEVVFNNLPEEEELPLHNIRIAIVFELPPYVGYVLINCPSQH